MHSQSTLSEKILSKLLEISSSINNQKDGDLSQLKSTMDLIVNGVSELIPDSSAMIYTYDISNGCFDPQSRFASRGDAPFESDAPRSDGLGVKAILSRKQVFSTGTTIHPVKLAQGFTCATCYPLLDAENVLGVFYIFIKRKSGFDSLELAFLNNLANLTTMTLSATKQFKAAEKEKIQKDLELKMLRRAGMLISSRTSLSETLEIILKMALEVTDAKYGIFRLVDKQGKNLITAAFAGEKQKQPATESLPIDKNSITGLAALNREPLMISDLHESPWKEIYYPFDRALEMRSELAVPLIGATGKLEGVLNLESPQVNGFNKQDRYILQILATQAVASIQEIQLLDMLQELTSVLLSQPLQVTLQTIVEKTKDLLNIPLSILWIRDNQYLIIRASTNKAFIGNRIDFDQSKSINEIISQELIETITTKSVFMKGNSQTITFEQVLVIPLYTLNEEKVGDKDVIGGLAVYGASQTVRDFSQAEWDKKVLNILGYYVILAIQNAERQEAVRIAQEQRTVTEAFAAIGDIASNLMHQLNNKIGTIPVRVEGIQDKSQSSLIADPYLSANLDEIDRSAREAMTIVREGLFHLRPIQFMAVNIAQAIKQAITTMDISEEIKIQTDDLDSLPNVYACPKRLPLVFQNLLENALRVLNRQGKILITGAVVDSFVEICIIDDGPGIKPEHHEKIFELNYSDRSSDIQRGLGFGLWWVKTLMVRFGGGISVESDGISGSKFLLTLPIMKEQG